VDVVVVTISERDQALIDKDWLDRFREHVARPWEYPNGMAPQLTYGRHHAPPMSGYRAAVVLVLLSPHSAIQFGTDWRDVEWHVTLTSRAQDLAHHPGQVCFPGGRLEEGETDCECALREWGEELGALPDSVERLGALPQLYVFGSHHWVRPVMAITPNVPKVMVNPAEVEVSFSLPIDHLGDLQRSLLTICRGGLSFDSPQYETLHGGIWGATAMMLELVSQIWQTRPREMGAQAAE